MKTTKLHRALYVALCFTLALFAFALTGQARALGVAVSVGFAPPMLPVYAQPACPGPGYLWTPGYWAYDPVYGYYWVPGTWVVAPVGLLWTPGYWAFGEGAYLWHPGYWGPRVGFYGGVNYGFGYLGSGFAGGYWRDRAFYYNRAVTNINNTSITNVYNTTVVNNGGASHASFNGPGGVQARPNAAELEAGNEPHYGPTSDQQRHESAARALPSMRASANHGQPPIAAAPRAGAFAAHGAGFAPRGEAQAHGAAHAPRSGPGGGPGGPHRPPPGNHASSRPGGEPYGGRTAHADGGRPMQARTMQARTMQARTMQPRTMQPHMMQAHDSARGAAAGRPTRVSAPAPAQRGKTERR